MATRDMTEAQYQAALKQYGFVDEGIMGYYRLPIPGKTVCVSSRNGGKRRRDKIAYLLEALAHEEAKLLRKRSS